MKNIEERLTLTACPACASENLRLADSFALINQCVDCSFYFDNPRPTLDALIDFYSKENKYDDWLADEAARELMWLRRLKKIKAISSNRDKLLDIGTGTGQFLHQARKIFNSVNGTEVSSSAIKIAKRKYNLDLYSGTIESLQIDKQFNTITMFHVLEHVDNPKLVVEKCHRLLAEDGILVIAVPNDIQSLRQRKRALIKKLGFARKRNIGKLGLPKVVLDGSIEEIHLSHFTANVLSSLLQTNGFEVIESSLDPYFLSKTSMSLYVKSFKYKFYELLNTLTNVNLYPTIWITARKRSSQ